MSLELFFRPRSIAVLGASRDPSSMGGTLLLNLLNSFHGPLFVVNPRANQVAGRPAYASILDVPEPVDLAFVAVPVRGALEAIDQCLQKGVRGIVVISAGFGEVDSDGRRMEEEMRRKLHAAGVPFVGPNCLGVLNTDPRAPLNGTFSLADPPRGNVAVCTQSGALGFVFPDYMRRWRLGVAELLSLGNKADIGENDLINRWTDEPRVQVVQLYLESFQDPRGFIAAARRAARRKPIVALKAGRGTAGQRAAGSHTAALASPAALADATLRQAGVIAVGDLAELFEATALVALQPPPRGRRTAILTNAGGPGVICADALEAAGLVVPEFSPALRERLHALVPPQAAVGNPIDLIGSTSPDEYRACLSELLCSDEVDNIIVIYVPRLAGTSPAVARAVTATVEQTLPGNDASSSTPAAVLRKPIAAVFMESSGTPAELLGDVVQIPAFTFPESAARALGQAADYAERRSRWERAEREPDASLELATAVGQRPPLDPSRVARLRAVVDKSLSSGAAEGSWLDIDTVHTALAACGLQHPDWGIAATADQAVAIARRIGGPVALKVIAPSVLHKARAGGIALDLRTSEEVATAWQRLIAVAGDARGAFVQRYVPTGRELFVGARNVAPFGPVVGLGRGGGDVERAGGVRFRLLPAPRADLEDLVEETRLLDDFPTDARGGVRTALLSVLVAVAALSDAVPELVEADFNPIKFTSDGGHWVVDARLRVADVAGTRRVPCSS